PAPFTGHPLLVEDYEPSDFARWPEPYKVYEQPRIELPREWPRDATPATRVLAQGAPPMAQDLAGLARVLFLSSGIVRTGERPDKPTNLFRAAGSAGGRFPLEVYVSARGIEGLDDGIYWYDPTHALVAIGPPAATGDTTLVVTGVPVRTAWRYVER